MQYSVQHKKTDTHLHIESVGLQNMNNNKTIMRYILFERICWENNFNYESFELWKSAISWNLLIEYCAVKTTSMEDWIAKCVALIKIDMGYTNTFNPIVTAEMYGIQLKQKFLSVIVIDIDNICAIYQV